MDTAPPAAKVQPRAWEIFLKDQQHTYLVNSLEDPQVAIDLEKNQPVVITPLYAAPQPETPKQPDSGHVTCAGPSELDTAELPEAARPWRWGLPDWATDEWLSTAWTKAVGDYYADRYSVGSPGHAFARAILAAAKGQPT